MQRITRPDSPYTFLEQRLRYIEQHPERDWTVIVDNVPQWPYQPQGLAHLDSSLLFAYGPCNGNPGLIDAICGREQQFYRLSVSAEQVLITNGALHGLSLLLRLLYRPGSVAFCQAPILMSLAETLKKCGYAVEFFGGQENIEIEELRRRCTDDVRVIYVNSPHNPTGAVCSPGVMNQLVELAQERGIKLIVDLVYDSFTFDDVHPPSPLLYSDSWHHLYIVNSMSKNFGAPGLRIGWIISDDANIQTLAGLLERECIAVGGSAQEQAAHLIRLGNQPLVEQVQAGRLAVEQMLQAIPALRFRRPAGGTQFFVELPIEDVEAFADFMLLEYGLVLATTSNYAGLSGAFVRIPMGRQLETVHRALALLSAGLNSLT